jgi:hypothetical protein
MKRKTAVITISCSGKEVRKGKESAKLIKYVHP